MNLTQAFKIAVKSIAAKKARSALTMLGVIIGLAAVIIGEVLCDAFFRKGCNFSVRLSFVILGGIVYYLVMVLILWLKLDPNDLKLFTAVIVAAFLAVPYLKGQAKSSFHRLKKGDK